MARILIVDDHKDFREVWRIFLEEQGHDVMDTADGADALRLCRAQRPDLVILDVFLPRKSGMEALWEIRRDNLARKVVVISGGRHLRSSFHTHSTTVLEAAREMGADMVLAKPVEPEELLNAVAQALVDYSDEAA